MVHAQANGSLVRIVLAVGLCLLLVLMRAPLAQAQTKQAPQESPPDAAWDAAALEARAQALQQWVDAYTRWTTRLEERRLLGAQAKVDPKPDPPEWLSEDCRMVAVDETGLWADACRLLADWKDDALTAQIRQDIAEARQQREAPTNTRWWQHVHLDALWPMTQSGSRVYGIVGTHATVDVAGRLEVFIAPGAMVLTVPTGRGTRDWKVATDWGVTYRLADFTFPGSHRQGSLHLNLVTAWIFGGPSNVVPSNISLAGFSFTFKKSPTR